MEALDPPPKKQAPGAPAWMCTFADLMSLLLAFFVLLFSFSELDKQKFKQLAGSMRDAFGVQREVQVRDTPIGNNIIAREFSPGRPELTPLNQVRQSANLKMQPLQQMATQQQEQVQFEQQQEEQRLREQTHRDLEKLRELLAEEIKAGLVEVLGDGEHRVIVRILEVGSFPSGSDTLNADFVPVIDKIAVVLAGMEGMIVVAGHTDDRPIHTARFRSNWELSAARAVTVMHAIRATAGQPESRFRLEGYGQTQPVAPNDLAEARARNRRVEVILDRSLGGATPEPTPAEPADLGQ